MKSLGVAIHLVTVVYILFKFPTFHYTFVVDETTEDNDSFNATPSKQSTPKVLLCNQVYLWCASTSLTCVCFVYSPIEHIGRRLPPLECDEVMKIIDEILKQFHRLNLAYGGRQAKKNRNNFF